MLAARDLHVISQASVGRSGDHTRLTVEDQQGNQQRVIWWQSGSIPPERIDLAFSLRTANYKGERQLQIEWIDARPAEGVRSGAALPALEFVDYRDDPDPLARLRELGEVLVWREVDAKIEGKTRLELTPAPRLAIWTTPPGSAELQAALATVKPETVYLFAHDPGLDAIDPLITRLVGLIKFLITPRGRCDQPFGIGSGDGAARDHGAGGAGLAQRARADQHSRRRTMGRCGYRQARDKRARTPPRSAPG